MSSLGLLRSYGSSSEDNSDDEGSPNPPKRLKKERGAGGRVMEREVESTLTHIKDSRPLKKALELPSALLGMFRDDEQPAYSTESHGGRKRTFAHERGNWATFVHVPYPYENSERLKSVVLQGMQFPTLGWSMSDDFHISLSRTVTLPHHCIQPLFEDLRRKTPQCEPFAVRISPQVTYYTNDEKTRTFLSLPVDEVSSKNLGTLVKIVDCSFRSFRLEEYYANPSFHISFAWISDDVTDDEKLEEAVDFFTRCFTNAFSDDKCLSDFTADKIHIKSGNKMLTLDLG